MAGCVCCGKHAVTPGTVRRDNGQSLANRARIEPISLVGSGQLADLEPSKTPRLAEAGFTHSREAPLGRPTHAPSGASGGLGTHASDVAEAAAMRDQALRGSRPGHTAARLA